MAEKSTHSPELQANALAGLNQRLSRANLPPGVFSKIEALYPANSGLLERLPQHKFLRILSGEPRVLGLHQTFDSNQNVIVQTDTNLQIFTLDELLNRAEDTDLTFPSGTEEEDMSIAILQHRQAATTSGGTLKGVAPVDGTFYGIVLTEEVVDEDAICTLSTPGVRATSGSDPTAAQFQLAAGTYRIEGGACCGTLQASETMHIGLYNVTDAAFEVFKGTAINIIGTTAAMGAGTTAGNYWSNICAQFEVSGGTKTFEIRMAISNAAPRANDNNSLGIPNAVSSGQSNIYAYFKILKES